MPAHYKVILTAEALEDLEVIAAHIDQQSPQNAAVVAERILDGIDSLSSMPTRFKMVGRSRRLGSTVHAMVVRPFLVYYRVDAQPRAVFVLHVIHGARRQPRRFG